MGIVLLLTVEENSSCFQCLISVNYSVSSGQICMVLIVLRCTFYLHHYYFFQYVRSSQILSLHLWRESSDFIFCSTKVMLSVDRFAYVELFLEPMDKVQFIMLYDHFNVQLNSTCLYFVEKLWIYLHQRYWPVTFFLDCVLVLCQH